MSIHRFFLVLLLYSALSITWANDTNTSSEIVKQEPPLDWSKPVVSRGFGNLAEDEVTDAKAATIYNTGQVRYFFGDYVQAAKIWVTLAEQGYAEAQASLGWMYQMGLGVEKDLTKAFSFYQAAAAQNNAVALNNLGVMYEQGLHVNKDLALARDYYALSAQAGYRFAQYNFAVMLLEGSGGEKNEDQGKYWLQQSARQNVQQAKEKLKAMNIEFQSVEQHKVVPTQ